jgi:hypothetical protein
MPATEQRTAVRAPVNTSGAAPSTSAERLAWRKEVVRLIRKRAEVFPWQSLRLLWPELEARNLTPRRAANVAIERHGEDLPLYLATFGESLVACGFGVVQVVRNVFRFMDDQARTGDEVALWRRTESLGYVVLRVFRRTVVIVQPPVVEIGNGASRGQHDLAGLYEAVAEVE